MRTLAFIGSRDTTPLDQAALWLYKMLAYGVGRKGHQLVTGAAPGCDQLAAGQALDQGGQVLLVLPWASYERRWVDDMQRMYPSQVSILIYTPALHAEWTASVTQYHPAPHALTRGARALHARNYGIVIAADGVIALPSVRGGGTMQGLRIAQAMGKEAFDLRQVAQRTTARRYVLEDT